MKVRTQIIVAAAGTVIGGSVLDVLGIVNFRMVGASAWSWIELEGVWKQVNEEVRMLIERNTRRRIQQAKEKAPADGRIR